MTQIDFSQAFKPTALLCSFAAMSGCGLFEIAGEVSFGEGQIPHLLLDFELPSHEQFLQ